MNDADTTARDYRDTVFLPKTSFPMRGDLPKREPVILARWQSMRLAERMEAQGKGLPPFILHDGPPYANGHLHIGHALNKIHKDVINRAQRMAGRHVQYVPGWDCHGLPIEWKVEEEFRAAGRDKDAISILQFRAECRAHAERWLLVQDEEFRRLGIEGDWAGRYATMDFAAEAAIAGEIGRFLLNGLLYRGLRPVMWSTVEKTALAEAEIEYHEHKSTTIFVRFPLVAGPLAATGASVVIWTTTPWTIPGNRALAFGETIDYALIRVDEAAVDAAARPGERLLLAVPLLDRVAAETGIAAWTVEEILPGAALAGHIAAHPLRGHGYDHDVPLLAGDFVTADQGTGFVHIAPSHGEEDFALGLANGLEVPETVGADGRYADWVPNWAGLHVFKAADPVCAALTDAGRLLARGSITHSYPHSWRSRAPLIYRATPQWFIRVDGEGQLRRRALAALRAVDFVPPGSRHRLESMLANRPDWCISRQRAWGVPIPVFVHRRTGEPLRDPAVMERVVEIFRAEGADAWFAAPPERFLGPGRDPADYDQVLDIVDVWFESGSTHAFVLEARGLPWPADVYLEGSDQHRGWFQASLLEAVGTRGHAPFRTIVSDGFVLDEQGRKMSKSLGNGVAPQAVCDQHGADILRLWAMSGDLTEDVRIGPEILRQQAELYRRLRNTLRWLLGGLGGWTDAERVPYGELPELERFILGRAAELGDTVDRAIASHDWVGVAPAIHAFCAADLSAFYFDIRKDVLYCDKPSSPTRRATRTVLDALHHCLATWLAPLIPFTAEDAWTARFGEGESVHLARFPERPAAWRDAHLAERWNRLRAVRRVVTASLEAARQAGRFGSSLAAHLTLPLSAEEAAEFGGVDWAEHAIVSSAAVAVEPGIASIFAEQPASGAPHPGPVISLATGVKCARCWRVLDEVGDDGRHRTLCLRCADAVEATAVLPTD
jgi:isoleucyl-tRNA synthetase